MSSLIDRFQKKSIMRKVKLKPLFHRGKSSIGIYFDLSFELNAYLRKIKECRWSKTHLCWYVPLEEKYYKQVVQTLKGKAELEVDTDLWKPPSGSEKKNREIIPVVSQITTKKEKHPEKAATFSFKNEKIHPVNAHVLPALHQHLKLKAYSPSTIKTYLGEMAQLLKTLQAIPAYQLTVDHLKRYFVYCFEKLGVKENTLHSRINALKCYYEQVLGWEKFFWEIPRPKKPLLLPHFFNQEEIAAIIKAAGNIKHRTMLMLAYATGMRVSEVVAIRTMDIDSRRMCILIRQAKGKKDRMVTLSPVLLVMLREYWTQYKPSKDGYLFQGQDKNSPYTSRSLQMVLADAKKKAGIIKPGSIHALRHSFATHLLDKGTDVTMIMKLLGHNDLKTTLRYLHVTNRDMLQIISPLDGLDLT